MNGTVQGLMDNIVKHTYSLILTPESYPANWYMDL